MQGQVRRRCVVACWLLAMASLRSPITDPPKTFAIKDQVLCKKYAHKLRECFYLRPCAKRKQEQVIVDLQTQSVYLSCFLFGTIQDNPTKTCLLLPRATVCTSTSLLYPESWIQQTTIAMSVDSHFLRSDSWFSVHRLATSSLSLPSPPSPAGPPPKPK